MTAPAIPVAEWCVRSSKGHLWGVATTHEAATALAQRLQARWKVRLYIFPVLMV